MEGFRGFARYGVEIGDGEYQIVTVKPGRVKEPGGRLQAPHIAVTLMARGMLNRVVTRIYFGDEEEANAEDPILALVPADRRPHADRDAGGRRLPLRHPPPGTGRDGLL